MLNKKMIKKTICLALGFSLIVGSISLPISKTVARADSETISEVKPFSNYSEAQAVLGFITNNVSRFVEEYNKTLTDDECLSATYIEYSKIVQLVEDSQWGVYIDFDGNNGYTVVTSDYKVYELETYGDFSILRNIDDIRYSYIDGFFYVTEDGALQKVINEDSENSVSYISETGLRQGGESATNLPPDGEILPNNINKYVSEKYPNYTFEESCSLRSGFIYSKQYDTSYYVKTYTDQTGVLNGDSYSEGNCVLNSTYMLLLNWQQRGFVQNLITTTLDASITIESDPLYSYYGTETVRSEVVENVTKYYKWEPNWEYLADMPILYSTIRYRCVNEYGYNPETLFPFAKVENVAEYVANTLRGNNINVKSALIFSNALDSLHENKVAFMGINGSSTYKDHGVVLMGYQKYSYESGWWIFTSTKYAYFYEIADGWSDSSKFFDPNTEANPSLTAIYLD